MLAIMQAPPLPSTIPRVKLVGMAKPIAKLVNLLMPKRRWAEFRLKLDRLSRQGYDSRAGSGYSTFAYRSPPRRSRTRHFIPARANAMTVRTRQQF
jgi:hypothetical protein